MATAKRKRETGVSVVVPVYNEERAVRAEVERILAVLNGLDCPSELIVVDDGSVDATADQLADMGKQVVVLRHEVNRGYGAALKTGIRQAQYPIVAITDADGTYPFEELPRLLQRMEGVAMVVGARTGAKVHIPLVRRPAKWVLNRLANYLSDTAIPDLNSGFRLFRKEIAQQYFHILPNRFSFTSTITLAMIADGYSVRYESIDYHKREGSSKIKPSDAVGFFILILRTVTYFNPLRTFVPLFLLFFSVAVVKLSYDIFVLDNITDTSTLLFISSLQIILIGIVADLVVRRGSKHDSANDGN